MVSLEGRLPQKLQSNITLSCKIILIHSLFRHCFIKKPKSKFNRNRKIDVFCSHVTDFEKQILVLIWLQILSRVDTKHRIIFDIFFIYFLFHYLSFRGSMQNTRLFSICSSFIFCSIIYLFRKRNGAYSCLPSKDSLNHSLSLFKGWLHLWSFYSVQSASCSFTCTCKYT